MGRFFVGELGSVVFFYFEKKNFQDFSKNELSVLTQGLRI